ncbi:evolutionarily conserved signaling intermediate in Toll pathway, mitochondrial precursor [Xenopus laevis]|uniref:Evolutionarily conserved signaling intermediate in Toll pathway, mitochondrial n=1 Tax=Xenopus laevis TaxID=8355 RepID=ECSIT_XENLA|nr:evolutionarily conserved signaling intermediate in Toll pathway, mitochondrial precursor [Xenopus laevis]A2VD95.1 RecName: Full=Evolutionarily conserved signaling intermediate in Toll pathway, mitochondrial; Flags: Precursor [Xenopus laevis]AAI29632.1 LOC100037194 protein [Xenopus laevis]
MRTLRFLLSARHLSPRAKGIPVLQTLGHKAQRPMTCSLHTSQPPGPPQTTSSAGSVAPYEDVFKKEQRNKSNFVEVLDLYCKRDTRRRGHVEIIETALRWMPEFGVEKDLEVYNKLLDVFPKEIFIPQNFIQRMFNHYPRQQECAIRVLEQMEHYGITPNKQTCFLLLQIFGDRSHPIKKYQRMMYWFPRFKYTNPFPVPAELPADPVELSRMCLHRIAADLDSRVAVHQMPYTEKCDDGKEQEHLHIVGIQSPSQVSLLAAHDPSTPVYVEGPFPLWLKKTCVYYYILRADPDPMENEEEIDNERSFYYPLSLDIQLDRDLGDDDSFDVDDVVEGPVFAMCMAGSGDERLLGKWIRGLQETNPILGQTPVVFRLNSGPQELSVPQEKEAQPKQEVEEEEREPERHRMEQ